jgi:hypothetical protein
VSRSSDDVERAGEDRFVCPDYLKRATVEGLDASYLGSHDRTGSASPQGKAEGAELSDPLVDALVAEIARAGAP